MVIDVVSEWNIFGFSYDFCVTLRSFQAKFLALFSEKISIFLQ